MPQPPIQTYANHVRRVPLFYMASFVGVVTFALWSGWTLVRQPSVSAAVSLAAALGICGLAWMVRTNALVVQDRVIRLEERLRMARLLPDDLRPRIDEFTVSQLAALRFASDAELPDLARRVLVEKIERRDEIKRAIKHWRADWHRV